MTVDQGSRWLHLFRESFVPVIIVILALFLMLLYVQFRAEYDADKVTVIDILATTPSAAESEAVVLASDSEPLVTSESDPELQRASALMAQKKWREAEQIYMNILAKRQDSASLNNLGVLYLKQKNTARALEYFNRAIVADPNDARALFHRALTYARSGRMREAIDAYRALLEKKPDHFEGQFNLGMMLIKQGDKAAGVLALGQAAEISSGKRKAHALYSMGLAQRDTGKLDDAARSFQAAIRLQPGSAASRVGLATLEPDTPEGQQRALDQYRKILELKPNYSPALVNMAAILRSTNKRHDAEQLLRQAIQFDPEYERAHTELGALLLDRKRWQDARNEFEWLLRREPDRSDAYFNLGRIAYGEKDYGKAISEYQTAIKLSGGSYPEALLNLGLTYSAKKDYAAAIKSYDAALKSRRQYPEAWYNTGMVYLRQQDYQAAETAFKNAVRLKPDYEQAWFNLGVVYSSFDRDADSMDAYRKALSIRPEYPQAQLNLAVRYAKRKEYGEAIRLYRAILAQDDTYSVAWFDLGSAYIGNQQAAEAVDALRKATALEPANSKTLRFLGRALLLDGKDGEAVQVLENALATDPADARLRLELARALRQSGRVQEARVELSKARQLNPKLTGDEAELQSSAE